MRKWLAMLMAMMLLGSVALAEPAAPAEPADGPALGGRTLEQAYEELIVGSTTAPSGNFFSDLWGNNTSDIDVRSLLHAYSLVTWQAEQGMFAVDPSVVSGITATADTAGNKVYTVALADDLMYSDGTRVTARDYVFSILLSAAPQIREIGGMTAGSDYILGASEYAAGTASVLSGVRLLGDNQFSVTVRSETLPFFYELGMLDFTPYPISRIAPGCEVADDGAGAYIRNIDQAAAPVFTAELLRSTILDEASGYMSHPAVTSGPYRLTGYDAGTKVATFEINPYYKGTADGQKPQIQRLTLKPVTPDTMMEQLKNGEVDLLNKCTQASVIGEGMAQAAQGAVVGTNYMRAGLTMLSFDCAQGPGQYQKVRQAVAQCLDREAFWTDYVSNSYGIAVNGYYGMGQWMVQLVSGTTPPPLEAPGDEATAEETAAYDAALAAWERLTLDNLNPYAFDVEAAKALLIEDGWTLNEAGAAYDEASGGARYKQVDGQLMKLALAIAVPEGNAAADSLEGMLAANLMGIGAEAAIVRMPFEQLLAQYYRQQPRTCNVFYLGTNFTSVFDPSYAYSTLDAHQGTLNTTGLRDEQLAQLAMDMHKTQQGDVLSYCQKWIDFETRWNELLPAVPVYSNVYFDFYTTRLQNYAVGAYSTWAQAVTYAYLSDAAPEAPELEDVLELDLT